MLSPQQDADDGAPVERVLKTWMETSLSTRAQGAILRTRHWPGHSGRNQTRTVSALEALAHLQAGNPRFAADVRDHNTSLAPSQVARIEFAAERFGTRLVVVLGHSRCGAVQATLEELEPFGRTSAQPSAICATGRRSWKISSSARVSSSWVRKMPWKPAWSISARGCRRAIEGRLEPS